MVRNQLAKLAFVVAVVVAAGAGCSQPTEPGGETRDGPTKGASNPPSPSPTPTPTSTSTQTRTPSIEDEKKGSKRTKLDAATRARVEQTVRAYLNALDKAYRTGDTSEVKGLAHEKCGYCDQLAAYIEDVYRKGGRFEGAQSGDPRNVKVGDLFSFSGIRQVGFSAKLPYTGSRTLDKSGKTVESESAGVVQVEFTVELDNADKMTIRTWRTR